MLGCVMHENPHERRLIVERILKNNPRPDAASAMGVKRLGLSKQTTSALLVAGVIDLVDILALGSGGVKLINGIGERGLEEIRQAVHKFGERLI
jgi:DNA-directed RNA polymerase alpha subunit